LEQATALAAFSSDMTKRWTAEQVFQVVRAFQPACVVAAAVELDVFSALQNQPMSSQDLSGKLRTDPRATGILLDALTALDFLSKKNETYSVPSDVAELLTIASPRSIVPAIRHLANCLRRWAQLAHVTQTGRPAERTPSILGEDADEISFIQAMENFSAPIANEIIKHLQPLRFNHLLDIGGASGTWTIAFLHAVPSARATIFDLPEVISMARQQIAEAQLSDRVEFLAGDYTQDVLPTGADFAWLSAVAHQNSRRQNRQLFAKIHTALTADGLLVIRDVVMEPSRTAPVGGALFAVNMLVGTEAGGAFTFEEFKEDLSQTGFTNIELVHRDQGMNSLIRARKP